MAIAATNIWAPRNDAAGHANEDIVGTFRSGMVVRRQPKSLTEWRVTTDDPDVAETIEEMFGGTTSENDSDKESLQVMTTSAEVDVIFHTIDSGFSVWAANKLVRACNGEVQTQGDEAGQPCPCAGLNLEERKAFADKGGCKPAIAVVFQLADAPNLGKFRFRSGAWTLLEPIQKVEFAVDTAREEGKPLVNGRLALEVVTTKAGKSFTLPRVTVRRG